MQGRSAADKVKSKKAEGGSGSRRRMPARSAAEEPSHIHKGIRRRYSIVMPTKKSSGKRTTIKPKGDARYIRRDSKGRIKESDDVGRSLKKDREKKAKRTVRSGQGDRGDQKR